jgi:cbb3-type cytochrome oxidase subunit 3
MTVDGYFAWVLILLSVLIFIALVLGFLYMVYGKEETDEEED